MDQTFITLSGIINNKYLIEFDIKLNYDNITSHFFIQSWWS